MSGPTDLPEIDHLLDLLTVVAASTHLTNRLGEELLLVPQDVMAEIRRVLTSDRPGAGQDAWNNPTHHHRIPPAPGAPVVARSRGEDR